MAHHMPPNLLAIFAPNPPLKNLTPLPAKKHFQYTGLTDFIPLAQKNKNIPVPRKGETPKERKAKRARRQKFINKERIDKQKTKWNPKERKDLTTDPYKTLFIGRLSYKATKEDINDEFKYYGQINSIHIVNDKEKKPRGYAFVEFKHKDEMKKAYKKADGRRIRNRRIIVDVERGRTVKGWLPRRLGGGVGSSRKAQKKKTDKHGARRHDADAKR